MKYLEATARLKKLIKFTNSEVIKTNDKTLADPNFIVVKSSKEHPSIQPLNKFTNEAVKNAISNTKNCTSFVITDIATMEVKGKKLTYYLYKGYHEILEKGLVFFQPINEKTLKPIGELQFSNGEQNIFFNVSTPDYEESSCNALETKNHSKENPEIAFLIGHTSLERLSYDIHRLIIDTVNNVSKNPQTNYRFIIQASLFGVKEVETLQKALNTIAANTKKYIEPEYSNTKFHFEIGE